MAKLLTHAIADCKEVQRQLLALGVFCVAFRGDHDFVMNVVQIDTQSAFVREKLESYVKSAGTFQINYRYLARKLAHPIANDPKCSAAWFKSGLPLVFHDAFRRFRKDRDTLLRLAKKCTNYGWRRQSFYIADKALRGDHDFMMKVVEIDGQLYTTALLDSCVVIILN